MKIDGTSTPPIGGIQGVSRLTQVNKKMAGSATDKIAVSDKAQVFQALLQKTKEIPSVREDRVRALTEQIEFGEFKVDGQIIANKLFKIYEKE